MNGARDAYKGENPYVLVAATHKWTVQRTGWRETGHPTLFDTKEEASLVCGMLNEAYAWGLERGRRSA